MDEVPAASGTSVRPSIRVHSGVRFESSAEIGGRICDACPLSARSGHPIFHLGHLSKQPPEEAPPLTLRLWALVHRAFDAANLARLTLGL
jgi:hypothetical protein